LQDHTTDGGGLFIQPGTHASRKIDTKPAHVMPLATPKGSVVIFDRRLTHASSNVSQPYLGHASGHPPRVMIALGYGRKNAHTDEFEILIRLRQQREPRRSLLAAVPRDARSCFSSSARLPRPSPLAPSRSLVAEFRKRALLSRVIEQTSDEALRSARVLALKQLLRCSNTGPWLGQKSAAPLDQRHKKRAPLEAALAQCWEHPEMRKALDEQTLHRLATLKHS
jgi:hypothetical protein